MWRNFGKSISMLLCIVVLAAGKLQQVVSMHRHGARYHLNNIGGVSMRFSGELTPQGMRQHLRIGQQFRKEYIEGLGFLSSNYNSSQIQAFSTGSYRAIQSMESQLLGLYPPSSWLRLNEDARQWEILPYNILSSTTQAENSSIHQAYEPIKVKLNPSVVLNDCPNFGRISLQNMHKNPQLYNQMKKTYDPFIRKMVKLFHHYIGSNPFEEMFRIYDVVNVEKNLTGALWKGLSDEDWKNLKHLANWFHLYEETGKNTLMFNSGKFSKIFTTFENRIKNPHTYGLKWAFLSGHDNDILAMYLGLNISTPECIEERFRNGETNAFQCEEGGNDFASHIVFELHSQDRGYYVKVRSNGRPMKICNKDSYECEYSEFKRIYEWNVASEAQLEKICGKKIQSHDSLASRHP